MAKTIAQLTELILPTSSSTLPISKDGATQKVAVSTLLNTAVTLTSNRTLADGVNMVVGTTTGTKIGTATTQKLGFFNATPAVQPALTADLLDSLQSVGLIASGAGNTPLDLTSGALTCGTLTAGAATTSSVSSTGAIRSSSATAGVGYATGAGGTVTQATGKTTGVTLNNACGSITLAAGSIGNLNTATFTLTNSAIAATDVIVLNHVSGGTAGAYVLNAQPATGSASINITNVSGGSLNEQPVIRFAVIKSVNS